MNILIVDDELEIAELVQLYLKHEGFNIIKYNSSKKILEDIDSLTVDLLICDVMMPELDGFSLVAKIREKYTFPIIMVTAKVEDIDKIHGLTIGADDYITKPFQPLELVARVKAQLRRSKNYNIHENNDIYDCNGLHINNSTHECILNEKKLQLTPLEFEILWYLVKNSDKVVKNEDLFLNIWKEEYYENDNNTIMVHIRHLREKIATASKNEIIKTVWGVGYKIEK